MAIAPSAYCGRCHWVFNDVRVDRLAVTAYTDYDTLLFAATAAVVGTGCSNMEFFWAP
jgi:hypothetical protein